jgi:hypothetical protein
MKLAGGAVIISIFIAAMAAAIGSNAAVSVVVGLPLALLVIVCGAFIAVRSQGPLFGLPRAVYTWAALLAAPLTAVWIWYMFAGPGYYAEFNRVKAGLVALPGVELIQAGGNRDLTFEDIWAKIRIHGKGEITLMSLTPASLINSADLHLAKIGPYSFRNERWGYGAVIDRDGKPVWHQSIGFTLNVGQGGDFGPNGRLAGRLQPRIKNVRDVIQHYDEVIALLESLRQEKLFFRDDDGATFEYSIRVR